MPSSSSPCSGTETFLFLLALVCGPHVPATFGGDLNQDIEIKWGEWRGQMLNNGQLITLSLDRASGSGFQSKNEFLFGKFDMQIKLVPGNSAGTVTAFYTKSRGSSSDEIDFEFLGNLSGDPYILHTNVITPENIKREQQFYLWFDPIADFHTYSILWNPQCIIFYVDGIPIREFKNYESNGVPFATKKPMRVYGSLWDAEDWATRGGLVKTNWSAAPFSASFRDFNSANACVWSSSSSSSSCNGNKSRPSHDVGEWIKQELDPTGVEKLKWVQRNYMLYNYCTDLKRISAGLPPECTLTKEGEEAMVIQIKE